jgi:Pentapeptide repeats (8 copies)
MQTSERLCPTADFAGGRSRFKWGGMLVMLHDPLLLDVILETRLFSSSVSHRQENVHEAFSGLPRLLIAESISATVVLSGANLSRTNLVGTNLANTTLKDCSIYGISAWDVQLEGAVQLNLTITPADQPTITVDNLKIAQFIYLLLNNAEIREVIDTIARKVVLILGRFTPERKAVLDALRDELRKHNYSPMLFDFEKPASRDLTETVSILAHLARFIIVDLTDPSSAPHEVATVIPHTVVPVQPLLSREPLIVDGKVRERREYAMFEDLRRRYHWVLPTFRYQNINELLDSLQAQVIAPAEEKARELTQPK